MINTKKEKKKSFWKRIKIAIRVLFLNKYPEERAETLYATEPDISGLNEEYLFDFKNFASQYNGSVNSDIAIGMDGVSFGSGNTVFSGTEKKNIIRIKPKDVLNELEIVPNPFTLTMIDEKITILTDKADLITQHYAKREIIALIERLKNRKKFVELRSFFDKYQNTTDEKINTLINKHNLVMKTADIFVPEFPDEAVVQMKEYNKMVMKICKKKAVFYVIAENEMFDEAYKKRDPILLVQSPFGFFWQIIGAWDKEMILLSEL